MPDPRQIQFKLDGVPYSIGWNKPSDPTSDDLTAIASYLRSQPQHNQVQMSIAHQRGDAARATLATELGTTVPQARALGAGPAFQQAQQSELGALSDLRNPGELGNWAGATQDYTTQGQPINPNPTVQAQRMTAAQKQALLQQRGYTPAQEGVDYLLGQQGTMQALNQMDSAPAGLARGLVGFVEPENLALMLGMGPLGKAYPLAGKALLGLFGAQALHGAYQEAEAGHWKSALGGLGAFALPLGVHGALHLAGSAESPASAVPETPGDVGIAQSEPAPAPDVKLPKNYDARVANLADTLGVNQNELFNRNAGASSPDRGEVLPPVDLGHGSGDANPLAAEAAAAGSAAEQGLRAPQQPVSGADGGSPAGTEAVPVRAGYAVPPAGRVAPTDSAFASPEYHAGIVNDVLANGGHTLPFAEQQLIARLVAQHEQGNTNGASAGSLGIEPQPEGNTSVGRDLSGTAGAGAAEPDRLGLESRAGRPGADLPTESQEGQAHGAQPGPEQLPEHGTEQLLGRPAPETRIVPTSAIATDPARFVHDAPTVGQSETDLFGTHETALNTAREKGELSDFVKKRIAQEKTAFKFNSDENRAGLLAETGNKLDTKANAARASERTQAQEAFARQAQEAFARQAQEAFARQATQPGPVAEALNDAAVRMARGENTNGLKQRLYETVWEHLRADDTGGTGGGASGGEAASGRAPDASLFDAGRNGTPTEAERGVDVRHAADRSGTQEATPKPVNPEEQQRTIRRQQMADRQARMESAGYKLHSEITEGGATGTQLFRKVNAPNEGRFFNGDGNQDTGRNFAALKKKFAAAERLRDARAELEKQAASSVPEKQAASSVPEKQAASSVPEKQAASSVPATAPVTLKASEADLITHKLSDFKDNKFTDPLAAKIDDALHGGATKAEYALSPDELARVRAAIGQITPAEAEAAGVRLPALKKRLGANENGALVPNVRPGSKAGALNLNPFNGAPGSPARAVGDAIAKFADSDLKPGLATAKAGTKALGDFMKGAISPGEMDAAAKSSELSVRELNARRVQHEQQVWDAFHGLNGLYDKLTPAEQHAFFDRAERGTLDPAKNPLDKPFAIAQKAVETTYARLSQKFGLQNTNQGTAEYFARFWKDPAKAQETLGQSNRSLMGTKGFTKQRSIDFTSDGLARGLELRDNNPLRNQYAKIQEMTRFEMGQDYIDHEHAEGRYVYVPRGQHPAGLADIDDPVTRVFRPSLARIVDDNGATVTYPQNGEATTVTRQVPGQPDAELDGHFQNDKGLIEAGRWMAPEGSARVINRFLSPGLKGNPVFDIASATSNNLRMVKFGLSGFHAMFTAINTVAARGGLAVEQLARGDVASATKTAIKALGAPVDTILTGKRMRAEYLNPGSTDAKTAQAVDWMVRAGGRARQDAAYTNQAGQALAKAWNEVSGAARDNNPLRVVSKTGEVALRAPFAGLEAVLSPIMEHQVPYAKMAVFADMAADRLGQLDPAASPTEQNRVLADTWNHVDDIIGQMVYDNLFWNRAVKDVLQATTQVGWNYGSLRNAAKTVADTATLPQRAIYNAKLKAEARANGTSYAPQPLITGKIAYTISLLASTMMLGSAISYLHGHPPQSLYDRIAPQTGHQNKDGSPERLSLPTYVKDYTAYVTQPPGKVIQTKESVALSTLLQLLNNKDYFDEPIVDFSKGAGAGRERLGQYGLQQLEPISVDQLGQSLKQHENLGQMAERFLGIAPQHIPKKRR